MKIIGITGGVGAGKSEVLSLIGKMTRCVIVKADDLARSLEVKGEVCYEPLVELLGADVLSEDGEIDSRRMAAKIFADGNGSLRSGVNSIVHPAVKRRIKQMIKDARKEGYDHFFIEAALLIEDHYDKIVDELWYIYADEDIRRARLKASRGYSDEKIDGIIKSQSSDDTFRKYCSVVIDNSGSISETEEQIKQFL